MNDFESLARQYWTAWGEALRTGATPMERALIEAVALRYSRDPAADRAALDAAYADAMLDNAGLKELLAKKW